MSMSLVIPPSLDRRLELLLTTREAGKYLGVGPDVMRGWRKRGVGPRYIDYGSPMLLRYPISELDAWKAQNVREPGKPGQGAASLANVVSLTAWRLARAE
jgi:Helix-turn-helix domain